MVEKERLHTEWESVAEREKRSRTIFAQEAIRFDGNASELSGEHLEHWRGVIWDGFRLVAATPYNEDLERRVKTLAAAFRAVLPTLVKAGSTVQDDEDAARSMREHIADIMAAAARPQ